MIKLIEIPINDIICLENNPRDISEENLIKLSEDIKHDPEFLFQRPPLINLVNNKYYCYAGNQRVKAALLLNYETLTCFVEENLHEDIQNKRMLMDNLHRGEWNKEMLFGFGFDIQELENFGFDSLTLGFKDVPFPDDFTAPKKDNPPTLKLTFVDAKQMNLFESALKNIINDFEGVTYSISMGEI